MKFSIESKRFWYTLKKTRSNKISLEDLIKFIESKPDYVIYKGSNTYRKITMEQFIKKQPVTSIFIHKKYEEYVNKIISIVQPVINKYLMTLNPIEIYKNIEIRDEI